MAVIRRQRNEGDERPSSSDECQNELDLQNTTSQADEAPDPAADPGTETSGTETSVMLKPEK